MINYQPGERWVQSAHLLRRAGFGGTSAEIEQLAALSHTDAVEQLLNYTPYGLAFNIEPRPDGNALQANLNDLIYWWLLTIAYTRNPLQEKMTLFWHGHFTTAYSKTNDPYLLIGQNELYRDNALGNFKDLVKKVSRDPAMLDYLDGRLNRKGKPNENYARELMELFTIGIGNYTENDVREAARAFTGWTYKGRSFYFDAAQHDNGQKTFMGKAGNFDGDDIIEIILGRRETARYITAKLWRYFVYEDPTPDVLEPLTDQFFSNYEIKDLLRAIFTSPQFLSDRAYRALVKSPIEYTVGILKQLDVPSFAANIGQLASSMGQVLFNPPDVKGWDGGLSWINSADYFDRVNAANTFAINRSAPILPYNPYSLLGGVGSADEAVDRLLGICLDGRVQPEVRAALVKYLSGTTPPKASDFANAAAGKNEGKALDMRVRGTLHLIMSAPDYFMN